MWSIGQDTPPRGGGRTESGIPYDTENGIPRYTQRINPKGKSHNPFAHRVRIFEVGKSSYPRLCGFVSFCIVSN